MPKKSEWRASYAPEIAEIISTNPGADEKHLRKLLREASPGGMKGYHPYKMWLKEVRQQLNQHFRGHFERDAKPKPQPATPGQLQLL